MARSGLASLNNLATAVVMGSTVDEPDTKIEPDRPPSVGASDEAGASEVAGASVVDESSSPPQAVRGRVTASAAIMDQRFTFIGDSPWGEDTGSPPCDLNIENHYEVHLVFR